MESDFREKVMAVQESQKKKKKIWPKNQVFQGFKQKSYPPMCTFLLECESANNGLETFNKKLHAWENAVLKL